MDLLRIAARVAATKTYPFSIDSKTKEGEFRHDDLGVVERTQIEYIPISDVNVQKPWSEEKLQAVRDDFKSGKVLDPVRLTMPDGKGKWEITDGIHRTNVSLESGLTHVPAITTEYIPFGEEPKTRTVDPI